MKKLAISVLAVAICLSGFAQKPKKTYNAEKFMKKVQFSFTPDLIGNWMPDDEALKYVSEKTGTSLEDVKSANQANLDVIKAKVAEINALGLVYVWDGIEVKIIQESPIKIADLLIQCHAKDKKFVLNLTNCIQTNLSWYLGDGIVPTGDGFSASISAKANKKPSKFGNALNKMNDANNKMADMETKAQIQLAVQQMKQDSLNALRPGYEARSEMFVYDKSKINIPMRGYYIWKDGTKVEAVIGNQAPEMLFGDAAIPKLVILEGAGTKPTVLTDESNPNFKESIQKNKLKAFYVNGYLYKNIAFYGWVIALNEGAIQSYLTLINMKSTVDGKDNYTEFKQTRKLSEGSVGSLLLRPSEKQLLKMMSDEPGIVAKYKSGELTLEGAEIQYNILYDQKHPGEVDYALGVTGKM